MKIYIKSMMIILGFIFTGGLVTNVYALENPPVHFSFIEGYADIGITKDTDMYFINLEGNDDIDHQSFHEDRPFIIEMKSLYQTFIIKNSTTNELIYQMDDFEYIQLDSTSLKTNQTITIRTNQSTYELLMNQTYRMYFINHRRLISIPMNYFATVDVDHPPTIDEINSRFVAWDNQEGDISERISIIIDNYTDNKHELGDYQVVLSIIDVAGNETRLTYMIKVIDNESPKVVPPEDIYVSYKTLLDLNDVLERIEATDNHATNLEISIDSENYVVNYNKIGTYTVEIMVDDFAGNAVIVVQTIHVIDDVAPVIEGIDHYRISVDESLDIQKIINELVVFDEVDYSVIKPVIISNNYIPFTSGTYKVVIQVEDNAGNFNFLEINIEVYDDTPPIFYLNLDQIVTSSSSVMTDLEIIQSVAKKINFDIENLMITHNEYSTSNQEAGLYKVLLSSKNDSNVSYFQIMIRVIEDAQIEEDPNNSILTNPWTWTIMGSITVLTGIGVTLFILKKKSII